VPGLILLLAAALYLLTFRPAPDGQVVGVAPPATRLAATRLALPDLGGRTWTLDERRGKVVLVNYWATWCRPCRRETPGLVRLANQYRARGLEVVGISLDQNGQDAVRWFVRRYRVPYPVLLPPSGSAVPRQIEAVPTTLLIDRQGRVAKTYVGAVSESTFRSDVESLLAE